MGAKKCVACMVIGCAALATAVAFAVYSTMYRPDTPESNHITNFEECAAAGNPVMESYPRQCHAGDRAFTENITAPSTPSEGPNGDKNMSEPEVPSTPGSGAQTSGGCIITGCSNQICAEEEVITTCELRPEYTCYQTARCGRLQDGSCGWFETPELQQCLENVVIRGMELPE